MTEGVASENPREGLLDDSNFEDLYDNPTVRQISSVHYWFGKRLFELMLAEKVFRNATASETSDGLDVMLQIPL